MLKKSLSIESATHALILLFTANIRALGALGVSLVIVGGSLALLQSAEYARHLGLGWAICLGEIGLSLASSLFRVVRSHV